MRGLKVRILSGAPNNVGMAERSIAPDCKSGIPHGGSNPSTHTKLVERALVASELTDARQSKGDGRCQWVDQIVGRSNYPKDLIDAGRGEWFESLPREH